MNRVLKKWLTLTLLLCVACATTLSAQEQSVEPKASIKMHSTSYDFGRLSLKGNKKTHVFHYTNTGSMPLIIQRATTSCNCIDVKYSRRPVAPGEQGEITIIYDPKKELGAFNKGVHISTSAGQVTLFVKGEVLPKHKKVHKR